MTVLDDAVHLFGDEALQNPYPLYDRNTAQAPVQRIGGSQFYPGIQLETPRWSRRPRGWRSSRRT